MDSAIIGFMDNLYSKMLYKVDWLAFTIPDESDKDKDGKDFLILEGLGYDVDDFKKGGGRYFYNSSLTLGNYVNVYYNDYEQKISENSSYSRNYVFTGQGCTDLAQKIDNDWVGLFQTLLKFGVKVTRIDLALDDFHGVLDFEKMENKLKMGHYKSSKKTYNVVKEADVNGNIKGYTIYIGKLSKSSKGSYYLRMYDKYAQYETKNQLPPEEAIKTGIWQRYEISFTKKKASKIVAEMAENGVSVGGVYLEAMKDIVQFLKPSKDPNKARWKVSDWWVKFLNGAEKIELGDPERDADIGRLLRWLRVAVVPALNVMQEIGQPHDIDFFEILKNVPVESYSKKQARLLNNSRLTPKSEIERYFKEFEEGRI